MNRKKPRKTVRAAARASAYYLRSIPADLWEPVMAKAKAQGRNVRWVILQALRDWLDGLYEPAQKETGDDHTALGASAGQGKAPRPT